jgi:hypothetical protein
MYFSGSSIVLGFHGTDEKIVNDVLSGKKELVQKNNRYDWLGNGIYFWDNNPERALEWAKELSKKKNSTIKKPAVIGVIIDLKNCLDLLDSKYLKAIQLGYQILESRSIQLNEPIPQNRFTKDKLIRELDCAVIETFHNVLHENKEIPFDSVRGIFTEGNELYPNAGFREKDHIQICVRNIECIKGYFLPLKRIVG